MHGISFQSGGGCGGGGVIVVGESVVRILARESVGGG